MICEKATFCTRVQVGTARDASAIPCDGCVEQSCPAGLGCHGWDASAIPSVGSEWGSCTDGTLRRHHGLWVGLRFAHGCRSVPLGTLRDTMRWVCRLFVVKIGLGCRLSGRFGDAIRLGWGVPDGRLAITHRLGLLHRWDATAIPWSVGWLSTCTGAGRYRSGRFAISCGGVRGRSWSISDWVTDGRDASAIPSVWVGVYPVVGLDTSRW